MKRNEQNIEKNANDNVLFFYQLISIVIFLIIIFNYICSPEQILFQ